MKKVLSSAVLVAVLVVSFAGIAAAEPLNPGQICRFEGRELISGVLEEALYMAHGIEADIDISQGACASLVGTHINKDGKVNTQAVATSFCKEVGVPGEYLAMCVDHVEPTLVYIFHGM